MKYTSTSYTRLTAVAVALLLAAPTVVLGQSHDAYQRDEKIIEQAFPTEQPYSPWVNQNFPQRPLFGDTHLHTAQSFDAVSFGTSLGPEDAYRFARGEEVVSSTGVRGKLSRPLDFLVVADHAENMGTMTAVKDGLPEVMTDETIREWNKNLKAGGDEAMNPYYAILKMVGEGTPMPEVLTNKRLTQSIWEKNNAAAEKYNEPGRFTAFIGYEWSSNAGGNNLHRVVMYRDASDKANQMIPFSSFISENPEDLWKWMAQYEKKTGGQLLAIPHNGKLEQRPHVSGHAVRRQPHHPRVGRNPRQL